MWEIKDTPEEYLSDRLLAVAGGHLSSMSIAFGPVCRMRSREFFSALSQRTRWPLYGGLVAH